MIVFFFFWEASERYTFVTVGMRHGAFGWEALTMGFIWVFRWVAQRGVLFSCIWSFYYVSMVKLGYLLTTGTLSCSISFVILV